MPNYSITVWSSDTYFSEGDEVVVHENTRRRPRGFSGEITSTELRNGRRMHEVRGHWYPERDLKPKVGPSPMEKVRNEHEFKGSKRYGVLIAVVAFVLSMMML